MWIAFLITISDLHIQKSSERITNSRCYCKEKPINDRKKLWYFFTCTIIYNTGISRVVFLPVRISHKRMLCETRAIIARAQAYALRTGLRWMSRAYNTWQSFFFKTTFEWSACKNNIDFVQLLTAFRYSNICFLIFATDGNWSLNFWYPWEPEVAQSSGSWENRKKNVFRK